MVWVAEEANDIEWYHKGRPSRPSSIPMNDRKFVIWDSEGTRDPSDIFGPTHCSLIGCYNGTTHERIIGRSLRSLTILEFIMEQGRKNPDGIHVAFAFGYDVNMILKGMPYIKWIQLNKNGHVYWSKYRIEYLPGKWFRLSMHGPKYNRESNSNDKETVTIFDVWGFFQSSLKAALDVNLKQHPIMEKLELISAGKDKRDTFTYADIEFIETYWAAENEATWYLINNLRDNLYRAGYLITSWHGPGAIANYVLKKHRIDVHMSDDPAELIDACRYAYAGGRFEVFNIGRSTNAFSMDIRSAYPSAIRHVPSWANGTWHYLDHPTHKQIKEISPKYALFHIRLKAIGETYKPAPFFHRDKRGNVTFPWILDGWYWSPEVIAAIKQKALWSRIEFLEMYWFEDDGQRPFNFVNEMFDERNRLKQMGDGAQMAHKLAMNSLYGKTAQRAGFERNHQPPKWHDLKTAGYVTSYARAKLYELMARMPTDELIAVETDGLYTKTDPATLGIVDTPELGGWEITPLDEIVYLQSGVYAKRTGDKWSTKYRGLDKASISERDIIRHATLLLPQTLQWPPLLGTTTRFIGGKRAMIESRGDSDAFYNAHTRWLKEPREIGCGNIGKRRHTPFECNACLHGQTGYDMPHQLHIHTEAIRDPFSQKHDIPWLDKDSAEWRDEADEIIMPEL